MATLRPTIATATSTATSFADIGTLGLWNVRRLTLGAQEVT
ncbi:hypothetical protein [Botrimarina sp.]